MAGVAPNLWDDILAHLRLAHPDLVRGWFSQLPPGELDRGILFVTAANTAQVNYLERHCMRAFSDAAQATFGRLVTAVFKSQGKPEDEIPSFIRDTDQLQLSDDYMFETFITGPCNRLAHAAAIAVADSPGRAYNPLFVHGSVGLGKTHLLQAICHQIYANRADARVFYISCESFTNHFLEAVEQGALHQFRHRYRHVDVLVIDDIQFLAERERSQEEFFHTFNTLHQSQRQIVLSADCAPTQIPSLEDRLVSRFHSGLVACMEPPCFETRMAIIRSKARLRCINLPEDVVQLIAGKTNGNVRALEGLLVTIDAMSQTRGGTIDESLVYSVLVGEKAEPISIGQILSLIVSKFGVRKSDVLSKKRNKSIAYPRQVGMYLARKLTPLSLEEIGGHFGGRDHTTVLHAIRRIEELGEADPQLRDVVADLSQRLRSGHFNGEE